MTNDEKKKYIFDLLSFWVENKKTPARELASKPNPLFDALPKHLYKYRGFGKDGKNEHRNERFLQDYVRDNSIWVSTIYDQNDPTEGISSKTCLRIQESKESEVWDYYQEKMIGTLIGEFPTLERENAERLISCYPKGKMNKKKTVAFIKQEMPSADVSAIKKAVASVDKLLQQFNAAMEDSEKVKKDVLKVVKTIKGSGIYSMALTPTNQVLWDYYAENYSGYVVEYDFSEPFKSNRSKKFVCNLFPAIYEEEKNDDWLEAAYTSIFAAIKNGTFDEKTVTLEFSSRLLNMMCEKPIKRSFEEEWRYFDVLNKDAGKHVPGPLISSIIVGNKISDDNLKALMKYAKGRYPIKQIVWDSRKNDFDLKVLEEKGDWETVG